MSIPLSQLDEKLEKLIRNIEKEPHDMVLFAIKQAEAIFKDRVFSHQGGKDKAGQLLPRYSKAYKEHNKYGKRKTASHWDLVASKDLMDSIKPNMKKTSATLEFNDNDQIKKAGSLELRAGTRIFEFSEKEKKEVVDKTVKETMREIRRIIKKSFQ